MLEQINLFPFWLSLKTALISTIFVFIIGMMIAYLVAKKDFFGKSVLEAIIMLPLVLPPTVVGFGLLYLFGKNGFIGKWLIAQFDVQIVFTWYGVLLAAIVVSFPLMYQSAVAAFQQYDRNLEYVAYTLGKSRWNVFWTISFPLAWPGLLSGVVLAFNPNLSKTTLIKSFVKRITIVWSFPANIFTDLLVWFCKLNVGSGLNFLLVTCILRIRSTR